MGDKSTLVKSNSKSSSGDMEPLEINLAQGDGNTADVDHATKQDTTDTTDQNSAASEKQPLLENLNVNPHHNTLKDECDDSGNTEQRTNDSGKKCPTEKNQVESKTNAENESNPSEQVGQTKAADAQEGVGKRDHVEPTVVISETSTAQHSSAEQSPLRLPPQIDDVSAINLFVGKSSRQHPKRKNYK